MRDLPVFPTIDCHCCSREIKGAKPKDKASNCYFLRGGSVKPPDRARGPRATELLRARLLASGSGAPSEVTSDRIYFCKKCYADDAPGLPPKADLEEQRLDRDSDALVESVQCDVCSGWCHHVCCLFNPREDARRTAALEARLCRWSVRDS